MRITSVRIHELVVPMKAGTVHSADVDDTLCAPDPVTGRILNFWEFSKWIVEIVADNGLIGLGEPRRGDLLGPLREQAELIVGRTLAELPVGDLPLPHGDAYESYIAYEAYEMAWLDLLGRHWGVPVHHLLGGKRMNWVPIDFWMGRMSVADTRARTRLAVELGFEGVKMKCTLDDPIVERVAAVRQEAPSFGIVLDPNERFMTLEETTAIANDLNGFDDIIFESPMPQDRLDWYAEARQTLSQPIALHLTSLGELQAALRADAADYYNLLGPVKPFVDWARMCEFGDYRTWRGTGIDLGIRDASSVHAVAAAGCRLRNDIVGHMLRADDLIVDPIRLENGRLRVPDRPGLGVELDRHALARFRVAEPVQIDL